MQHSIRYRRNKRAFSSAPELSDFNRGTWQGRRSALPRARNDANYTATGSVLMLPAAITYVLYGTTFFTIWLWLCSAQAVCADPRTLHTSTPLILCTDPACARALALCTLCTRLLPSPFAESAHICSPNNLHTMYTPTPTSQHTGGVITFTIAMKL